MGVPIHLNHFSLNPWSGSLLFPEILNSHMPSRLNTRRLSDSYFFKIKCFTLFVKLAAVALKLVFTYLWPQQPVGARRREGRQDEERHQGWHFSKLEDGKTVCVFIPPPPQTDSGDSSSL